MGTNYYRILPKKEFDDIKKRIIDSMVNTDDWHFADSGNSTKEDIIEYDWRDEEGNLLKVHLGKRSRGWKFLWNFHRNKFYSNKEELLKFIREGRVFDEYGIEIDPEEFIDMALNWCLDGHDSFNPAPCYDFKTGKELPHQERFHFPHDTYIDGLRISTPQEHSTFFS